MAVSGAPRADGGEHERPVTEMVEQPAKVMRIGSMVRQLLEEVRAAPLDETSRARLKEIHQSSIKELEDGLAPELRRASWTGYRCRSPTTSSPATPSCGSRRPSWSAGWRACSTASRPTLFAQQMAARAQLEQMRRGLPPGMVPVPPNQEPQQRPGSGPYL